METIILLLCIAPFAIMLLIASLIHYLMEALKKHENENAI